MTLHLRAKPNARTNELLVAADGSVTVRIKAAAQDGQANAALLMFLAEVFETSKSRVVLLSGHTSSFKKVALPDVDEARLAAVLARHCGG